jgi:hypothetical protein
MGICGPLLDGPNWPFGDVDSPLACLLAPALALFHSACSWSLLYLLGFLLLGFLPFGLLLCCCCSCYCCCRVLTDRGSAQRKTRAESLSIFAFAVRETFRKAKESACLVTRHMWAAVQRPELAIWPY